jgi:hypothetical protein
MRVRTAMRGYAALVARSLMRLRTRDYVPATTAETWVRADSVRIFWFIQTYRDLPKLRKTLARLRKLYPEAPVLVVSDGDSDPAIEHACDKYFVKFILQSRLFGVEHGGEVIQRMLEAFLTTDADVLIKIDPDTNVQRRFSIMPSGMDLSVYGSVQSGGSASNRVVSVQGGCVIVPRQAAILLANSSLLNSDRLKPPALEWAVSAELSARAASGLTSADHTLGWACRELRLLCKDHPEVCSRYRPSLMDTITASRLAVFHPRFDMSHLADPVFYFSGLRVAIREALLKKRAD